MGELRVGTSGWVYADWRGRFYPESLKQKDYLHYYARHFNTTEINYSFYQLPTPEAYRNWAESVPENFIFAVKLSRYITHIRRLKDVRDEWRRFLDHAAPLGNKLGPILIQLPPSFRYDRARLEQFLQLAREENDYRLAFEFRHASWFDPQALELLRKYGAAAVIADSSRYPQAPSVPTAHFVYLRFHGPGELFSSRYTDEQLSVWAQKIRAWLEAGLTVYAYFNNDFHAYAVANAKRLVELVAGLRTPRPKRPARQTTRTTSADAR